MVAYSVSAPLGGLNGLLESVYDGVYLPENTPWTSQTVWWNGLSPVIEVQLGGLQRISGYKLQADNNDSYSLNYLDSSTQVWQLLGHIPALPGWGMMTRSDGSGGYINLSSPIVSDHIRIQATGGDNSYSVSELDLDLQPALFLSGVNLLSNGSFEVPGGGARRDWLSSVSLPDWSYNNQGGLIYESSGQDGIPAADGAYYISYRHNGATGGVLSQRVVGVKQGDLIQLGFSLSEQQDWNQGTQRVRATVQQAGAFLYNQTIDLVDSQWREYLSPQLQSIGGDLIVSFQDVTPGGYYENWGLDAVELNKLVPHQVEFSYKLYEADGKTLAGNTLDVASWGSTHDKGRQYVLALVAESLHGHALTIDDLDVTLDFADSIFEAIQGSDVQITRALPLANAALIDNPAGAVRVAAGSADGLGVSAGTGIGSRAEVVRLLVNVRDDAFIGNGLHTNGLVPADAGLKVVANLDETVFSDLTTLRDRGGASAYATVSGPLAMSRAVTDLDQVSSEAPLVLGTKRSIGGASFSNLIRHGDHVASHQVTWENVGEAAATSVSVSVAQSPSSNVALALTHNGNRALVGEAVSVGDVEIRRDLNGQVSQRDQFTLDLSYTATGAAGSVIDLGKAEYTLSANGGYSWTGSQASTNNLITYQGDLNYDGRVSMQDLAYLNAGAQQVAGGGLVARDVDADFNGAIDLNDLAVLDADWGQSLHTGLDAFLGSNIVSMADLGQQGSAVWADTTFKDQNVIEAGADFVPSLDAPLAAAVIDGMDCLAPRQTFKRQGSRIPLLLKC